MPIFNCAKIGLLLSDACEYYGYVKTPNQQKRKKLIYTYKVQRPQDIYQRSKIFIVPFNEASDFPDIICLILESKTINDL